MRVLEVGCETEKAAATEQLAFTAAALQTQHLQHLQDETDLVADLKRRSFGHLIEVLALGGVTTVSGLAEALEHFQEWEEELPRTLSEHELAVLSEIVGYEPSEAESAEARVLELANGEDSEVGLAERCPTVEEVSREVMENLDESAGDEDEDEVGLLPKESDASRQQRKKDFQDLIGRLRSEVSRPEVARLMAKTDPGMMPSEYLQRMEALVARFEDSFPPGFHNRRWDGRQATCGADQVATGRHSCFEETVPITA